MRDRSPWHPFEIHAENVVIAFEKILSVLFAILRKFAYTCKYILWQGGVEYVLEYLIIIKPMDYEKEKQVHF